MTKQSPNNSSTNDAGSVMDEETATIDLLRAISIGDTVADYSYGDKMNSKQDYVHRRVKMWKIDKKNDANSDPEAREIALSAIAHLPLPMQVAFRRKMLTIFAVQLLMVWLAVGVLTYYPPATDIIKSAFKDHLGNIVWVFIIGVVLLGVLYLLRNKFPLNWIILVLFSAEQSVFFAALGVAFDTNLGFFNCGATFCCVLVMIALSNVQRTSSNGEQKLLSSLAAGCIAYVFSTLLASTLFIAFGQDFVTLEGFIYSLVFQLIVLVWFSWDAACMYSVMSPDEYMHGVIYFYTDMVLVFFLCIAAVGVAACLTFFGAMLCADGGADGLSAGCQCLESCYYCGSCTTTSYYTNNEEEENGNMNRV